MSTVRCSHCQLEFDNTVMIKEKLPGTASHNYFCCNGCQSVYHLLKDDGFDSFYERLGKTKLNQPLALDEDSSIFDMDSFKQRYIKPTKEGFNRVDLIIEGIHCSACIWLNEKLLDNMEGIVEASINFTNNKAKIVWDGDIVNLSVIVNKIRSIGYNAYPYEKSSIEKKTTKNNRDYFLRMSVAIFASLNIMMISVAKYTGFFTGMAEDVLKMVHIAEFIFSTPVLFYSGWVFYRAAYYGLKNKIVNMDLLVSTGATLTYIYSLYVLFGGYGHSYFDSVAMIITFVLVGKYLEVLGKKGAVDTMDKLKAYVPHEATIIENGEKKIVSIDSIKVGDIIEVKTGEKASVDGELISGSSLFDESSISGESIPILKKEGDKVFSGTINTGQLIKYKAIKDYANSTLNHIVELLEESLSSKPAIEEKTNEVSKYFSITILWIAVITFCGWYFLDHDLEHSLIITISVIIIACPCALALATPIASLVGISWLSDRGILFKEAKLIEVFSKVNMVIFDKTGTITKGKLEVKNKNIDLKEDELNILYSLVDSSTHPVSIAIKEYLLKKYLHCKGIDLDNIEHLPALGLQASYGGKNIFGGRTTKQSDFTTFEFRIDEKTICIFELEDTIKQEAVDTIKYLKKNNIEVVMCSGDNDNVVKRVSNLVGIKNYYSQMTPKQKADFIISQQEQNRVVVMVGDGINDTLALSKSDISIAMGNGADISLDISDVIILNDKLSGVKESIYISKRTFGFIKQNLALSLIYNIITIPIAIAGYVIPLIAALSMSLSSLLVVGNSMRIKTNRKV